MVQKKRSADDEEVTETPKYVAGKVPRLDNVPSVDYRTPFNPKSELFVDDWSIPKFDLFISYTLDNLIETYKNIFKDFIKLPSRKFHPQYYYKINQPISVNEIKSRDYEYPEGPKNFILDVELLAKNCASYNETDSLIVKNAYQMTNYIKYEVLKAKNVKRNYLLNDDIKARLVKYLDKLVDATEKDVEEELGSSINGLEESAKLCEPFLEIVDKDELPEYFEIIHRPMSLNVVKKNLEVNYYSKIYDVIINVILIFENALIFNDATTLIHQTSKALLEYFNHLMNDKFFPELNDASERGELKLEYDKIEYEKYLDKNINENNNINALPGIEDDEDDYDFNHIEGLGNGYTRSLLTEDYLLNPKAATKSGLSTTTSINVATPSEPDEKPEVLKYNVIKSSKKETHPEEYTIEKKPYTLIEEIAITTSQSLYNQAMNPMPGSRPSCTQNWLEFKFKGKNLNQNENMFSFCVEPVQTFLTITAKVTALNLKCILTVNKDVIKSLKDKSSSKVTNQDSGEVKVEENEEPEKFEIRLNEGLNELEFKCHAEESQDFEVMKFWVNVLP